MFNLNERAILGSYLDSSSNNSKVPVVASSSIMSGGGAGGGSGFNAGATFIQHDLSYHMLDGFINFRSQNTLYKIYREIYTMDAVTGPAIDQIAGLPWSSYSLLGIQDKQIMDIYSTSLSELNIIRLLTYMSTTYLVLGTVVGSLVFDKNRGIFSDCILYNPDDCEITPIPMIGYDPKVNVKISKEMIAFLNSTDYRDLEAKKEISGELEAQLRSGKAVMLEPLSTLVVCRNMLPGVTNLSYLSRILPIWIVEKALTRGTIQASLERQRGVLQVTCVHGSTQIYVDGKLKSIGSMVKDVDYSNPSQQMFDVNFYTRGLDDKQVRVHKLIYQGKRKLYQLTLFNGLKLKCTPDHKIACLDESGNVYFRELINLIDSDKVITVKGLSRPSYIQDLKCYDDVFDISIDTSNGDLPVFVANNIMVHNCIAGETLIDKDGKLVRIDSIAESDEPGKVVPVDFTTVGFNGKRVRVYRWIYQGEQEVYEVTTKCGYSIQATADHKFVVPSDEKAELVFKRLDKLRKGDFLAISDKNKRKVNKKYRFNVDKELINTPPPCTANYKGIKIPKYMTTELAYLLGMLLSDGYVYNHGVVIVGNQVDQLEILGSYYSKVFGLEYSLIKKRNKGWKATIQGREKAYKKDLYQLRVYSTALVKFLNCIGVYTSEKLNKELKRRRVKPNEGATKPKPGYLKVVPDCVMQADEESKLAFLAGYIDGDGCVNCREDRFSIIITSLSKEMKKRIQILFCQLGEKSRISDRQLYLLDNPHEIYEKIKKYILIKHKIIDSSKYIKETSERKRGLPSKGILAEINSRYVCDRNRKREFVFRDDSGNEKSIQCWAVSCSYVFGRNKIINYASYKRGKLDTALNKLKEFSPDITRRLKTLLKEEITFDPIVSIRKVGVKKVYDISIDTSNGDKPIFVGNGITLRNCGSEDFEYTEQQQSAIASLIANASRDPQGAVIVTRPDVSISEFRSGTDFWSISQERDSFTNIKLRALGLSESFGADTNYSSGENSITIFLEHMRSFRENFTRAVVYDKVFLLLAKYHGFRKRANVEIDHNIRYDINSNKAAKDAKWSRYAHITGSRNLAEAANFHIPEIKWTKELQARGDSNALSLLQTAKDLGMPLPIGLVSTFAGIPLPNLLDNLNEDIEARKKIKEYQDKLKEINPAGGDGEGDDSSGGMFGAVMTDQNNANNSQSQSSVNGNASTTTNRALLAKLRHTSLNPPRQLAKIKDKTTLLAYLQENVPPNVKITASQARQLLRQANSIKPGFVKL